MLPWVAEDSLGNYSARFREPSTDRTSSGRMPGIGASRPLPRVPTTVEDPTILLLRVFHTGR